MPEHSRDSLPLPSARLSPWNVLVEQPCRNDLRGTVVPPVAHISILALRPNIRDTFLRAVGLVAYLAVETVFATSAAPLIDIRSRPDIAAQ